MKIVIKAVISLMIILLATGIGKKYPSLAGLIAVMPLTGALVLVWLYTDTGGDPAKMQEYAKAALWGIVPSILFFVVAFLCFTRQLGLGVVLSASFAAWLVGACVHQWLLR
jgi:uncharacterized membrane protein (GlpM family)